MKFCIRMNNSKTKQKKEAFASTCKSSNKAKIKNLFISHLLMLHLRGVQCISTTGNVIEWHIITNLRPPGVMGLRSKFHPICFFSAQKPDSNLPSSVVFVNVELVFGNNPLPIQYCPNRHGQDQVSSSFRDSSLWVIPRSRLSKFCLE